MAKIYEPINWEDGTLVSPASVDLETGEITPAVYEGNTPATAERMNHMDKAIEELYKEKNSTFIVGDIKCKQLFNKNAVTQGYYLNASGELEVNSNYCVSEFIEVVEGETYFLPTRGTSRTKFYDSNKVATTSEWDVADGDVSFVVPSGVKYIRFSIANTISLDTFQFEPGDSASDYVEHKNFTGREDIITGQEVATNRFYNGKRIYVKEINCGTPTENGTKQIETGLSNVNVLYYKANIRSNANSGIYELPYFSTDLSRWVTSNVASNYSLIEIYANGSWNDYSLYMLLEYTKN